MTERLYYKEPGLLEFEARIVESGTRDDRFYTILDRSAFYPTSGGQLYDTGKLGDVDIVEVLESESGEVQHLSLEPVGRDRLSEALLIRSGVSATVDSIPLNTSCRLSLQSCTTSIPCRYIWARNTGPSSSTLIL